MAANDGAGQFFKRPIRRECFAAHSSADKLLRRKSGSGFEGRKVKGTIHWVCAKTAVPVIVREFSYLMDENEDGSQTLVKDSFTMKRCCAEPALVSAKPGERFQFFRHGYYIMDEKLTEAEEDGVKVFNQIVGLKSSWNK